MVDDPYTRQDYPCPSCNGCGQKVNFYVVYDSDGKEHTHQQADPCSSCGGSGKA